MYDLDYKDEPFQIHENLAMNSETFSARGGRPRPSHPRGLFFNSLEIEIS